MGKCRNALHPQATCFPTNNGDNLAAIQRVGDIHRLFTLLILEMLGAQGLGKNGQSPLTICRSARFTPQELSGFTTQSRFIMFSKVYSQCFRFFFSLTFNSYSYSRYFPFSYSQFPWRRLGVSRSPATPRRFGTGALLLLTSSRRVQGIQTNYRSLHTLPGTLPENQPIDRELVWKHKS